jgi:hypothetical protein
MNYSGLKTISGELLMRSQLFLFNNMIDLLDDLDEKPDAMFYL